jgi:hypothetical protein
MALNLPCRVIQETLINLMFRVKESVQIFV